MSSIAPALYGWFSNSCQPKAMSAFLSGEMKDTVELNPAGAYGIYILCFRFFSLLIL